MKLYFSSLMYSGAEFKKMLSWIKKYPGKLGVEIFVMFHEPEFETVLGECEEELKSTSVSFHDLIGMRIILIRWEQMSMYTLWK